MNVDFRNRHILISDVIFRLRHPFLLIALSDMNLQNREILAFYLVRSFCLLFFLSSKKHKSSLECPHPDILFYYIKLIKTVIARLLMKSAKRLPTSGTRR